VFTPPGVNEPGGVNFIRCVGLLRLLRCAAPRGTAVIEQRAASSVNEP